MYLVNNNFDNIKVGEIVAFDIGDFLGTVNDNITLVKVLEIIERESFYDYDDDAYEDANPLVKYMNINTNQNGECDIAWLFTKDDVKIHMANGNKNGRLEMINKEFECV